MGMFMDSCPLCWDSKDYCKCDPQNVLNHIHQNTNPKEVVRTTSTLDGMRKRLGPNPCDGSSNIEMTRVIGENTSLPDIIITGTDGDDYNVLNKVNRNLKIAAVLNPHNLHYEEGANLIMTVEQEDQGYGRRIKNATEETLSAAEGKAASILTPENKHWILREMGFKGLGGGKWKHILFDEEIEFDLQTDSLVQLAFQIHKTGYKNAHTEWASQQKTETV